MAMRFFNFAALPPMLKLGKAYALVEVFFIMLFIVMQLFAIFSDQGGADIAFLWAWFSKLFLSQGILLIGLLLIFFGIEWARKKLFWGGVVLYFLSQFVRVFVAIGTMRSLNQDPAVTPLILHAAVSCAVIVYLLCTDKGTKNYFSQGGA